MSLGEWIAIGFAAASLIVQGIVAAFFYGRLTQRVSDLQEYRDTNDKRVADLDEKYGIRFSAIDGRLANFGERLARQEGRK